jgi:IclR family KDG regulon transcriptional repressor
MSTRNDLSAERYLIDGLLAALDVVEVFLYAEKRSIGVTEISQLTHLKPERVFRILSTLSYRGYVEKDEQTKQYHLGARFLSLGKRFQDQFSLHEIADPLLRTLAQESGDAAHLWVRSRNQAICVKNCIGRHQLQAEASVGYAMPLGSGSGPKILLAYLPKEERSQMARNIQLKSYTRHSITDRTILEDVLREIRLQGYYIEEEEYELGACSIAAPVRDFTGNVIAAMSLVIPKPRYNPTRRDANRKLVVHLARKMSRKLGCVPTSPDQWQ